MIPLAVRAFSLRKMVVLWMLRRSIRENRRLIGYAEMTQAFFQRLEVPHRESPEAIRLLKKLIRAKENQARLDERTLWVMDFDMVSLVFEVFNLIVPRRLANEEIGDAMEHISRLRKSPGPWRSAAVATRVLSTGFLSLIHI